MDFASLETITDQAAERWRTHARDERLGTLMSSLVRYLHAFARENRLTEAEWCQATEFLTRVGQISNDKRKEFILLSDVLGLSMLVLLLNDRTPQAASQPTLLGPFYIPNSPMIPFGGTLPGIAPDDGTPLFISGRVTGVDDAPIKGALLDVWQTDHDGVYEAQLIGDDERHRGLTRTDADGRFLFRTVEPVDYPVPTDGPVGQLLAETTISEYRPAHIHFKVTADRYAPLVTHLFDKRSSKLDRDVVFGARAELLIEYAHRGPGQAPNGEMIDRPFSVLDHHFRLSPR